MWRLGKLELPLPATMYELIHATKRGANWFSGVQCTVKTIRAGKSVISFVEVRNYVALKTR